MQRFSEKPRTVTKNSQFPYQELNYLFPHSWPMCLSLGVLSSMLTSFLWFFILPLTKKALPLQAQMMSHKFFQLSTHHTSTVAWENTLPDPRQQRNIKGTYLAVQTRKPEQTEQVASTQTKLMEETTMFKEIHIENNYKNLGGGELNEANQGIKYK